MTQTCWPRGVPWDRLRRRQSRKALPQGVGTRRHQGQRGLEALTSEGKTPLVAAPPPAPVTVPGEQERSHLPASASGFVAVLASKRSRADALNAFAELQRKYPEVLAGMTPDVQEADLGDKGMWYRAVVGPPGSREAATNVCHDLKTAGHDGCWVAAY
jgi:hypothetical protein